MPHVGKNRKLTLQVAKSMIDQMMILGDDNDKSELVEHFHKWMFSLERGADSVAELDVDTDYQAWRKRMSDMHIANQIASEQMEQ